MIKEKHDKGPENVKEDPTGSDKESPNSVKKEDDVNASSCLVKKEPGRNVTRNGSVMGCANPGSLPTQDSKLDSKETTSLSDNPVKSEDHLDPELTSSSSFISMPPSQSADGVQPLISNVINKQSNTMEVQYMQQQSQIFVFSTMLANSGAEEVLQGRFPSIIAYHCAQPGTKKYLEKNPFKVTQFRQNPTQWLNNLSMIKNKNCARGGGAVGPKSQPSIDSILRSEGLDEMVGLAEDISWEQKSSNLDNIENVSNGMPNVPPEIESCNSSLANVQPSLQGVKVPDENLTPRQRQHREESLATIRKMQQMLFPENQNVEGQNPDLNNALDIPAHNQSPAHISGGPQSVGGMPPVEWQKMQNQFFDDHKGPIKQPEQRISCNQVPTGPISSGLQSCSGPPRGGTTPGQRLQGPPPPYHQTQRSASVPIALPSPNPTSPNNPTSNLSLPSPRASSNLNSPSDPNRPFGIGRHLSTGQSPTSQGSPSGPRLTHSNPGTPVSPNLSPSVNITTEPCSTHHSSSVDGLFGRSMQSIAQQKPHINTSTTSCTTTQQSTGIKEPNLMPVPSPQQIQYLNTFEGQELIIQKQPNISLKDGISPPILPSSSIDNDFPPTTQTESIHSRVSDPNTPTSLENSQRFPTTPVISSEGCRFQISSPQTPTSVSAGDKNPRHSGGSGAAPAPGLSPSTVPGACSDPLKNDLFPTSSPHMMDVPRFAGPNSSPGLKMGGNFVNASPGKPAHLDISNYTCGRADNIPLNPNCTNGISENTKVSHFDPISSLAQMSQQLTNSVASSLNGQSGQGPGIMNFVSSSMQIMDMNSCHGMSDMDSGSANMMSMPMQGPPGQHFHPNSPMGPIRSLSPKLPGAFPNHMPMSRMMGRPPGPNPYNGANVQVKPNAPNTIQYLPAKPTVGNNLGPRGPPSLDFLQRFANPMSMDNKMGSQNMHYFPSCGGNNPVQMQGPGGPPHMSHMESPMGHENMGPMMGGPMGNNGPMMGGNMGMAPGGMMMMRGPPMRPTGLIRMPQMGFNSPSAPNHDGMFNSGPGNVGNSNPQMFVGGPKGSPLGLGAPEASQPLPPSMGQSNTFKSSPFVGPMTADPNYAQQYHHFQQQLYATGTRSQMGGQTMGPGPPPHQQSSYFNPK